MSRQLQNLRPKSIRAENLLLPDPKVNLKVITGVLL